MLKTRVAPAPEDGCGHDVLVATTCYYSSVPLRLQWTKLTMEKGSTDNIQGESHTAHYEY